ncbi:MAG: hypothetical protein LBR25_00020 [Erysipelotrichaceae bacterium]|jgi:PTS system galactitol-specific IIC component|nr:hypothetical protein [Erysipelotrichaceae bacterium]
MDFLVTFFDYFSSLGNFVMIPLVIIVLGLAFRLKPVEALRSGMTIGIGLIALDLVLGLIWNNITPITEIFVSKFHTNLTTIDIGWAAGAGLAYSTLIGTFIIPFTIVINAVLFVTRITKTINIDIWNYWHYAFTGSCIYVVTNSVLLAFAGAAFHCLVSLLVADITAKRIQKTMGIPGITVTGGEVTALYPFAAALDKVYDLIFRKGEAKEFDTSKYKFLEVLTQPMFLGAIIGSILALMAGYPINGVLQLAMQMAALMFLLPRAVKILMEGFIPLSNQVRDFMQRRYANSDREINIGLDSAVLIGLPICISIGLIMIPIFLVLAPLTPFNTTLPLGDLASTCYLVTIPAIVHAKNGKPRFMRTLITCLIVMPFVLIFSSVFAPMITSIAQANAMDIPVGALQVTCLEGNLWAWLTFEVLNHLEVVGVAVLAALSVAFVFIAKRIQKAEAASEGV